MILLGTSSTAVARMNHMCTLVLNLVTVVYVRLLVFAAYLGDNTTDKLVGFWISSLKQYGQASIFQS